MKVQAMETSSKQLGNKRKLVGFVVSDKCEKTIVVTVETLIKHPHLKKYIKRKKKFMAHDPENQCSIGDKVQIIEHRPISARKKWHLNKVIEKAV
ncbi:30S ribosomal protein S17 [Desulfonatronovibrio magnus]|uniref:30S ribosomal protein S17 n=1 Tax=Desulfonatronovibrio magnus TaxID=698827 RepID=UPI001E2A7F9A|nr:30S ribosomal protein S17 [Desulfonatronovibrio magnus]